MSDILLLSDYSLKNKAVAYLTMQNHLDYAARWGIDVLYIVKEYRPHLDISLLGYLLRLYNVVVTVGTDIIFTDFTRDIREFCDDEYNLIIQEERDRGGVNGDFIFWNRTDTINRELDQLNEFRASYASTQDEINNIRGRLRIKVLPCRTIQSINPAAYSGAEAAWQPGDFSVHCHRPNHEPIVGEKLVDIREFLRRYPINQ